jgi:NAD(P) transhydrogenase
MARVVSIVNARGIAAEPSKWKCGARAGSGRASRRTGISPARRDRDRSAGDVIGFPALAATSMEQGRLATAHMFGAAFGRESILSPYGIYTIPEIAMIGQTEEQLTAAAIPYETGVARYEELAKAEMLGDRSGMLKLLFHPETRKLLGIHAIGQRATEIIHIGQAVLAFGGTIEYFRDAVFNYPTLAEAYKVAALNGLNKL